MEVQDRFNDMRVEIALRWSESEFDDLIENDFDSDFDVREWNKQNNGLLDKMFDDVEDVLWDEVGQYFGSRVYGKYHNDFDVVYQLTLTTDQLLSKLQEWGDEIYDIDEYNNWVSGYITNVNNIIDDMFGTKAYQSLLSKYRGLDDTAEQILWDILYVYTETMDFSVFEPTPEIVEFLEQYK